MENCPLGNELSILVSPTIRISMLSPTKSLSPSNLFLTELILRYPITKHPMFFSLRFFNSDLIDPNHHCLPSLRTALECYLQYFDENRVIPPYLRNKSL